MKGLYISSAQTSISLLFRNFFLEEVWRKAHFKYSRDRGEKKNRSTSPSEAQMERQRGSFSFCSHPFLLQLITRMTDPLSLLRDNGGRGGEKGEKETKWRPGIERENQGVPWRFTVFRARQPVVEFLTLK